MTKLIRYTLFLIGIAVASASTAQEADLSDILAQADQQEFLDVDDAFNLSASYVDGEVLIRWKIADTYYLYKHQLAFEVNGAAAGEIVIPDGKQKNDPYFGLVEVYYKHLEVSVGTLEQNDQFDVTFKYQGCAEAGLCYTPEERRVTFAAQPDGSFQQLGGFEEAEMGQQATATTGSNEPEFEGERELLSRILSEGDLLWITLAFFGAGLLLTFTPCVLPMIPILSSIIAGQGKDVTTAKAFKLSFVYVQAMAVTYATFGILIAQAGGALSGYLQHPIVLMVVAALFIILSLSMFGFYELQLPQSLRDRLQNMHAKQSGGDYLPVIIMGVLATLVVSPCTSAPLTAALLLIAQTGDTVMGGFSLYMLGMGMGVPLLIIGAEGGKWLPKAGVWMDKVKAFFGYMLLGLALYITSHLMPGFVYLGLWSILLFHASYHFGAFRKAVSIGAGVVRVLSIGVFVLGLVYLTGAFLGNNRLDNPLDGLLGESHVSEQHLEFEKFTTGDQLDLMLAEAKVNDQPVMVDFFAEWCVACYEFEDFTFKDKAVQDLLEQKNVRLLQVDVTANSAEDQAIMKSYKVLGLPTILLIDKNGKELTNLRATGFEEAEVFLRRLQAAFK